MYEVEIRNGDDVIIIHEPNSSAVKLSAAQIKNEMSKKSSFDFTVSPANPGYRAIQGLTTRVKVTRTDRDRIEFMGRVLTPTHSLDSSGQFANAYEAGDMLDYWRDVSPAYQTLTGNAGQILAKMFQLVNGTAKLEAYKLITLGNVGNGTTTYSVELGPETDMYDTLYGFVVTTMGWEMALRYVSDTEVYLDVKPTIGETIPTKIELGRNLQAFSEDDDPTGIITSAIPLGAAKQDDTATSGDAAAIQQRVCLADIGKPMSIDLTDLIAAYGYRQGPVIFDDVTDANQLTARLTAWAKTQRVQRKFTVTALDLSKIGLDADDFSTYNSYPVVVEPMGINETMRVTAQTIDLINIASESLTIGDKYKSAIDYATEAAKQVNNTQKIAAQVVSLRADNTKLSDAAKATEESVTKLSETVTTLSNSLSQADITGISKGITDLQSGLVTISENLDTMGNEISNLQAAYNDNDARLDALEAAAGNGGEN